jgi:integrase
VSERTSVHGAYNREIAGPRTTARVRRLTTASKRSSPSGRTRGATPSRPASVVGSRHQLRHAYAVELAREAVPLPVIQRQLAHSYVSTTSVHLQGIDIEEIIGTIHARRTPMMPASAGLEL